MSDITINNRNEMILVQKGRESDLINYLNAMPKMLALTYPGPGERDYKAFSEFFESPFRMERRMCSFNGSLAVDLTSYIKNEESFRLEELSSYIEANRDTKYIMYAVVDSMDEGVKLIKRMSELTGCRKLCYRSKNTVKFTSEQKTKVYGY